MAPNPLSFPLEVIERILKLAFLPAVPSSAQDSTEPTPPPSTSHLLLVSKGIRQICLPFFWRSITISKPSDWISLFDSEEGLVVVGEEGRRRWELVEEVRIVVEAVVPVVFEHLPSSSDWNRPSWIAKEEERDAFRLRLFTLQQDFSDWDKAAYEWRLLPDGSRERYEVFEPIESRVRRTLAGLEFDFWTDLALDRQIFAYTVFSSFRSLHAVIPSGYWSTSNFFDLVCDGIVDPLDFPCHLDFKFNPSSPRDCDSEPIFSANKVIQVHGGFTGSLVGFSPEFLAAAEASALDAGEMYAQERKWDSIWSWKRKDGSTFLIDFSKCWS